MSENLGKATLDLQVNLAEFRRNMEEGRGEARKTESSLDALAAISKITEDALGRVKMTAGQGAESKGAAETILSGVRGVSEESRAAAHELDR